jgi:hypothetical protein
MAIFKLVATDLNIELVVRAKCLSCARDVAAEHAGTEGTGVWRNPGQSTCELVDAGSKRGLILRSERP